MSDEATPKIEHVTDQQSAIEMLARETGTPVEKVHEIYATEHAKLEQSARIKAFVPVLVYGAVKSVLQAQRATRQGESSIPVSA